VWRIGWLYHGALLGAFFITRTVFLWWNSDFLKAYPLLALYGKGLLFDFTASSWVLLPMWLLLLVGWRKSAHGLWLALGSLALALEVIDIGYFPYTYRRSGIELLRILAFWQDSLPALSKYVRDFFAGFAFWGVLVWGLIKVGSWIQSQPTPSDTQKNYLGWVLSLVGVSLGLRGGVGYKPLSVIDGAIADCPQCLPFVVNTTFSMLKSIEQPRLPPYPPMPADVQPFPRLFQPDTPHAFAPRYNVVVFILESFSQEYIDQGYAPFLAELLRKGTYVKWGFATNPRSAEGVPAILSGMPTWGEEPLIFTPYVSQIQYSLGDLLRQWGYYTAFFHGGNNGTMLLDSYARQAGFRAYFGRNEYPYPNRDYDGTWGIWDEPFLSFCAQQLERLPQPFAAVIFTLSSHHPYKVPPSYEKRFPGGDLPIHRSIQYADWALSQFFAQVETTAWAKRTLFVFTADHTGPSNAPYHPVRVFHVPIGFYIPGQKLPQPDSLGSHIDIVPSILEAIGYPYPVPVWGRSLWKADSLRWAPQRPSPFTFQAVGHKHVLISAACPWAPQAERWEGVPWQTFPDSTYPLWIKDWQAYLASYGRWLQHRASFR